MLARPHTRDNGIAGLYDEETDHGTPGRCVARRTHLRHFAPFGLGACCTAASLPCLDHAHNFDVWASGPDLLCDSGTYACNVTGRPPREFTATPPPVHLPTLSGAWLRLSVAGPAGAVLLLLVESNPDKQLLFRLVGPDIARCLSARQLSAGSPARSTFPAHAWYAITASSHVQLSCSMRVPTQYWSTRQLASRRKPP